MSAGGDGTIRIGVSRPPTPPHPIPDVDGGLVAVIAEELGFESLFYGEHPIRPVEQAGYGVHEHGVPFFQDTTVMLARATALTTRLVVGGAVFLVPEHNPVLFAKQLASIDLYAGGRVVVGAGVGWSRIECELLGGDFDHRWAQTCESIEVMKKLWTEKTVTYAGEFFTVPPVQLFPPPATPGGPPVLIGAGLSRRVCDRIIRCADGWIPAFVTPPTVTSGPATVREGRAMLDRAATDADRDPSGLQITAIIRGDQVDGDTSTREVVRRDVVERFAEAGADRVLVSMPTVTDEATARAALERIAASVLR